MSGAKENQAVRSEASYLIFRPASVARACEAHEALTFWLLLGQAKSNRKKFFADALNDKLIVNCQWLIVMPGTRNPNAPFCHSEHREESRGEEEEDSSLTL